MGGEASDDGGQRVAGNASYPWGVRVSVSQEKEVLARTQHSTEVVCMWGCCAFVSRLRAPSTITFKYASSSL